MNYNKFIFTLFFAATVSFLQAQVRFNNIYDLFGTWDHATSIILESDGYFVGGTTAGNSSPNRKIALMKIDLNGNFLWSKSYSVLSADLYDYSDAFIKTSDSNYVFAGSINDGISSQDVILIKFNESGDTIWQKTFGDSTLDWWGYQCKETLDKGFIITGAAHVNSTNADILLIKTDSAGNFQWKKTIHSTQEGANSVLCLSDNKYLIGGSRTVGAYNYGWLIKTDSTGNLIWQKTVGGAYGGNILNLHESNDNTYIACGYICNTFDGSFETSKGLALKITPAGNIVWQKQYGNEGVVTAFTAIDQSSNGSLVACGTIGYGALQNYESNAFIVKMNSAGDSILGKEVDKYTGLGWTDFFKSVKFTNDGGFIVAGDFYANIQDMWVVKFDSLGCDNSACAINVERFSDEPSISVFPNPASTFVNVHYNLPSGTGSAEISLFDHTGKLIRNTQLEPGQGEKTISLADVKQGFYFLSVIGDERIIKTQKIAVIR